MCDQYPVSVYLHKAALEGAVEDVTVDPLKDGTTSTKCKVLDAPAFPPHYSQDLPSQRNKHLDKFGGEYMGDDSSISKTKSAGF